MAGDEAAEESRVRRVDNRIRREARDVTLPEGNALIRWGGGQCRHIDDAALLPLCGEQFILQAHELLCERQGRTDIHERTQQIPLRFLRLSDPRRLPAILRHLCEEHRIQLLNESKGHRTTSFIDF